MKVFFSSARAYFFMHQIRVVVFLCGKTIFNRFINYFYTYLRI